MPMVECRTLYNETRLVPSESMIQRPSVYGLIPDSDKLLVVQTRKTGKFALPGGGIHKGETIEAALTREVREETGLDVEVGAFAHFKTDFFYYDPFDVAIHGFLFFYYCQPHSTKLVIQEYPPEEDDIEKALWVDQKELSVQSFESHGELILTLLKPPNPLP